MGAEQRKHPAAAAGQSHIRPPPGAQPAAGWTELCRQPPETVRTVHSKHVPPDRMQSHSGDNGGFWLFFLSPGALSPSCGCMTERIR